MDKKLICENKFQFNIRNKVIGLPIKFDNLPSKLIIEENELVLKDSFHISLVCIGKIIEKYNVSIPDFENIIINDFCEFSKTNEIKVLEYNDFKFVVENDLKSIVVMCKISNLNKFFDIINKKFGLKIEYPPTHATLYTLPNKLGIFLTDLNDIKNLTKSISNPIGFLLKPIN
jgi:hypothetical protein